jgi:hypothetical protein
MPVKEMLEHLDRAMSEIQLVEESLNDAAHACVACGLVVREDFTEHQMRSQLAATRLKLGRFAGSLASRKLGA